MPTIKRLERVDATFVEDYSRSDWILEALDKTGKPGDEALTSHRWLYQDRAKRAIFAALYGDLLESSGLRVLDVGGGLSSFGRVMSERHDYMLVDLLAHDPASAIDGFRASCPQLKLRASDWDELARDAEFDIVVVNDLFPNVDQRLPMFLERFAGCAGELRMSLTYYEQHRFYRTRRVDADEFLTILAWDGRQTARVLEDATQTASGELAQAFSSGLTSAFANGRQVTMVWLEGDSKDVSSTGVAM